MDEFTQKMISIYNKALQKLLDRCKHPSTSTQFRALSTFDAVVRGEMSFKEYSRLTAKDLAPLTTCLTCGKQWCRV